MSYSGDKLLKIAGGGPTGPQVWVYGPIGASGTQVDAVATVRGAGYISDGGAGASPNRGMRVNDVVLVVDTNTPLVSLSRVSAISATGGITMTA